LIERWIAESAKDDTPADAYSTKLKEPPTYNVSPVISAIAYSPDGSLLAVSGYHEVLLHKSDGSEMVGRLVGESPRIESLAFSPDGKLLAVSGCAPGLFGEIQIWNLAEKSLVRSLKISTDALYGVSFSPDATHVAFGCADKTVRMINLLDGKELLKVDNHSDWVLGTTFTVDGKRLLTCSRDKAMKLIDASNGQFIDDINKLLEGVLCIARNPKKDEVASGGDLGTPRIYKISDNQGRTAANNDVNLIKEFERQPGPVRAIAFSPDGETIAVGGTSSEVRIYKLDGKRVATLKGHDGSIFSIAFHPAKKEVVTGGYDGKMRLYESESGRLITTFVPVPIKTVQQASLGK
jgi:WD40 repeat protein